MSTHSLQTLLIAAVMPTLLLIGCGGGTEVAPAPSPNSARLASSDPTAPAPGDRLQLGSSETLLVGASSRTILQLQPRSGRLLASLNVGVDPVHIAADDRNVYFGGFPLQRYEIASGQLSNFAFSDAYTGARAMAVSPAGTLFASNLYTFAPDTSCGTCSSVVAYPDPNGQNPAGSVNYVYGYVTDPSISNGRLSGQQIGFTDSGDLLVVSSTGYGVYQSNLQIDQGALSFTQLVGDPTYSTIRIATDGRRNLFVLHSTGNIDRANLASGDVARHFLSVVLNNPIDMAMARDGSIYVLEQSGNVKGFSRRGRQIASFSVPADAGQPLTIAFCCRSRHRQEDSQEHSAGAEGD